MTLSPLGRRRWKNFKNNKRALYSLIIFTIVFTISIFAELIANDRPLLVKYNGGYFTPILKFYPETAFGGDLKTEAVYRDIEVKCLIVSGGVQDCWNNPYQIIDDTIDGDINGKAINKGLSLIHISEPTRPY